MKTHRIGFGCWLFGLPVFALLIECAGAVTLRVSPGGRDGALSSLAEARDAIRQLKAQGPLKEPLRVIVAGGLYNLTEPFVLTAQDSGTRECPITYEAAAGARPVFSGGRKITGFKKGNDGIWEAQIADVASGKWYFEQLFVNGERAVRARTPNKWYHYMSNSSEAPVQGQQGQYRRTTELRGDTLKPLAELSSREIQDVTLVAYHKWCITRRFLTDIDTSANIIVTVGEQLKSYSGWPDNTRFQLENFKTALDAPGEWFLSRDGTLYY
ncbi:MAG: hypothetical protein JXN61_00030, partial [Sedimentisphaerales bacterium]|nr:hypothetical protein [Sedimentisphaerales bacterium]